MQKIQHFENRAGGKGWIHMEHLLCEDLQTDEVKLYAKVTIEPHASIGYHQHNGDGESYTFIQGEGMYNDNGTLRKVKAGDYTWTGNGQSHGIENTSDEDLVMIALVIRQK